MIRKTIFSLCLLLTVLFPYASLAQAESGSDEVWEITMDVTSEDSEVIFVEDEWRIEQMVPGDEIHTQIDIYNNSDETLEIVSIAGGGVPEDATEAEKDFASQFTFTLSKDGEVILTGNLVGEQEVQQTISLEPHSTVSYDVTLSFNRDATNEFQNATNYFYLEFIVTQDTDGEPGEPDEGPGDSNGGNSDDGISDNNRNTDNPTTGDEDEKNLFFRRRWLILLLLLLLAYYYHRRREERLREEERLNESKMSDWDVKK